MKKILALILACILTVGLAACAAPGDTAQGSDSGSPSTVDSGAQGDESAAQSPDSGDSANGGTRVDGAGFHFYLPAGWSVEDANDEVVTYTSADYPTNGNNVALAVGQQDPAFDGYTRESIEALYADSFDNFTLHTFERLTQSGSEAILLIYDLVLNGMEMKQYVYMIQLPDSTLNLIFTEVTEDVTGVVQSTMDSLVIE